MPNGYQLLRGNYRRIVPFGRCEPVSPFGVDRDFPTVLIISYDISKPCTLDELQDSLCYPQT